MFASTVRFPRYGRGSYLNRVSAVIARGKRPVPFRTRKLSLSAPMVLQGGPCGRVGRCRTFFRKGPPQLGWPFLLYAMVRTRSFCVARDRSHLCRLASSRGIIMGDGKTGAGPSRGSNAGRGGRSSGKSQGKSQSGKPAGQTRYSSSRSSGSQRQDPRSSTSTPATMRSAGSSRPSAPPSC